MKVPVQTAEIFKILSKGQFISSNSSDKKTAELYRVMEDEQNFDILCDYFRSINFILEKGNEYFYFSRSETKADFEKKVEAAYKWIDIIDFFKTFRNDFSSGYRFSPSDILVQIKTDADLETKLEGLKKYADKQTQREIVERILKIMFDDCFIELENPITQQYKVLSSFHYLEQLILTINIPEEVENEIPE